MVNVEICINCDTSQNVQAAVQAAYGGRATTVELCSDMQVDGLTPSVTHINTARSLFYRPGLMVMIRPRAGDFCYTAQELVIMKQQIVTAANAGADGVVLGALRKKDNRIAVDALISLLEISRHHNLKVTFHRAFDATPDPFAALDMLIDLGVDRVLTSGTAWGDGKTAVDGVTTLYQLIRQANGRIEIVIGGGINPTNIKTILNSLPQDTEKIAVHAYSGVQENGITTFQGVKSLVNAA